MPKYLFLCRHANTLERVAGQTDFERKLSAVGREEARQAGAWIQQFNLLPDFVTCSAAVRTTETAIIITQRLGEHTSQLIPDQDLYDITTPALLHKLSQIKNTCQIAIVVGHNPPVSEAVANLNQQQRLYVPTGGVNFFTFDCEDWQEITWSTFRLNTNY